MPFLILILYNVKNKKIKKKEKKKKKATKRFVALLMSQFYRFIEIFLLVFV